MMSMTVLVLVCIWHAIIPQIATDWGLELAHTSDIVVLVVLGSFFVIIHIIFALWIATRVCRPIIDRGSAGSSRSTHPHFLE